ncbi:hypothetical protein [Leyella stercorea]|uniref:hypothetical protein n=1 Tax=Leyella stercorea TaxID=363265 RepID=UPI00242A4C4A|nr:hypothetical protein [Leyella stercorea]
MTIVLGFCHPHRPMQTSAPTDADVRTDRRRRPHRPTQTSAPTDARHQRCDITCSFYHGTPPTVAKLYSE